MTPQWATDPAAICEALLLLHDDHWGLVRQTCDLVAEHEGDHMAELRACIPTARLSWAQTDD
jgi:hypothetical protein